MELHAERFILLLEATGASGFIRSLMPIGFMLVSAGALGAYLETGKFSWEMACINLTLLMLMAKLKLM